MLNQAEIQLLGSLSLVDVDGEHHILVFVLQFPQIEINLTFSKRVASIKEVKNMKFLSNFYSFGSRLHRLSSKLQFLALYSYRMVSCI